MKSNKSLMNIETGQFSETSRALPKQHIMFFLVQAIYNQ